MAEDERRVNPARKKANPRYNKKAPHTEPQTETELEPQTETELEPQTEAELEPQTETELKPIEPSEAFLRHEIYLEQEAQDKADDVYNRYEDQGQFADSGFGRPEVKKARLSREATNVEKRKWTDARGNISVSRRNKETKKDEGAKEDEEVEAENHGRVWIEIDTHKLYRLYGKSSNQCKPRLFDQEFAGSGLLPESGVDKVALMQCSELARQYFAWYPDRKVLHLPVQYPRRHELDGEMVCEEKYYPLVEGKRYHSRMDKFIAHISARPITDSIIPWVDAIASARHGEDFGEDSIPRPNIPEALKEKIHLYNAMQQLCVPRFIQRPLIEQLCEQMYRSKLDASWLLDFEMTVGRWNAHTVAVCDPVISAFTATYAHRHQSDRNDPTLRLEVRNSADYSKDDRGDDSDDDFDEELDVRHRNIDPSSSNSSVSAAIPQNKGKSKKRTKMLERGNQHVKTNISNGQPRRYFDYRTKHVSDKPGKMSANKSRIVPPQLPVLAHSIRNWGGIGQDDLNGTTKTVRELAHKGYPLNNGQKTYYKRHFEEIEDGDESNEASSSKRRKPNPQGADQEGQQMGNDVESDAYKFSLDRAPPNWFPRTTDNIKLRHVEVVDRYDVLRPLSLIKRSPGRGYPGQGESDQEISDQKDVDQQDVDHEDVNQEDVDHEDVNQEDVDHE